MLDPLASVQTVTVPRALQFLYFFTDFHTLKATC